MNLARLLTHEFGAEDREVEHLLACDECSVSNGYDGAELERCPQNPVRVESQWVSDLNRIGWGLMAAFEVPKRPAVGLARAFEIMVEEAKVRMVEELNRPIFFDKIVRTTSV